MIEKSYATLEPDNRLEQVIKYLDARQRIDLWKLENYDDRIVSENVTSEKLAEINYVYQLFDNKYSDIMEYVIDYMRFDFNSLVVAIKPDKWSSKRSV